MLANGIKLRFKKNSSATFTDISKDLKEVPELGNNPEKVENTGLNDKVKQYEFGIGDPGDLEYKFKFNNNDENATFRIMKEAEASKEVLDFEEELPDKTVYAFSAMVSVKLGGGGVNGVLEFTLATALQSDLEIRDPEVTQLSQPSQEAEG